MADEDRCVCCGEIVPEGMLICPFCTTIHIFIEKERVSWWKRLKKKFLSFWKNWKHGE